MKRTVKDFSAPTAKGLGGAVRRAATALLLMLLTTATAWADADLIIRSTADWNTFAANVANGTNDYAGKTVILAADISISTMAGADNYNFFRGTFDGCGHTLTINLTGTYAGTAPFRRIENATIKNLNVEGTITTNSGMAGSIAFVTNGITHITNCLSTVTITGNNSGTDGGLVSCNNNELYFTNCAFKGKLLGSDEGFGGFVGWNNITVVYNHCLFAPSQVTMSTNGSSTFTRGSSSSTSNYNNSCYYTQSFGTVQGTYTNATGSDLQALLGDGWEIRDGNVVPKMVNSLEVTDVPYRAYNTVTKTFETLTAASCEIVTKATTTMGAAGTESWYVVSNNATVSSSRIEVLGTVNLILADGKSMRAEKGIHVPSGGTLNIYDQSGGTGELHAFSNTEYAAGIGGNDREANGTITIHGGSIETWGDYRSPGIGSGYGANGGTTIIYGGSITATGGYYAAGIGGGNGVDNNAGIITIAGGSVTAEGGEYGAGIGGGVQASGGTITITGGTVIAKAKYVAGDFEDNSQAIGNGAGATHDCTLYIGDMKVYSSANASNPVAPANRESICQSKYAKLIPCTTHNYVNGECTYCGGVPNVPVTYLAYHTATQSFVEQSVDDPLTVNQHITTMGADDTETWYAVRKNVTFSNRIEVRGTVHLILCDGKTLTASKGITVNNGNSLTIYGQTAGTGALNATGSQMGGGGTESAPIGSTNETTMGSITIHGGLITANSIGWTAGIGGGIRAGGGSITIYGGIINATGSYGNSEAIGHGADGANVLRDLADGLRVTTNNNSTPVAYGDRVSGLSQKIARVEPCTEHYTTTDHCDYCGLTCYRVLYDSNNATDGTVPVDNTVYLSGQTVTVLANTGNLVRTGYTFAGWNTKANGSGTTYAAGATFVISGNITLYAKWQPITYIVRFHKNDGGEDEYTNQTLTYDVAQTLTANVFTRDDYVFLGWSTTPDGAVAYTDGQSVINLANEQYAVIDLYAKWLLNLSLANNDSELPADKKNTYLISEHNGETGNVTLADRTIFTDGDWNTLCLPFALASLAGTPLEGVTVKTLESSSFTGGTLTMTFSDDQTSIEAGKPYIVKWKRNPVDLSKLTAHYTAQDGDVLTGTLGGIYKISIADGARVTLDGATINGTNDSRYEWAGITCVGNATIILKGTNTVKGFWDSYPGIHVPSGKTLTILGSGSLTASSNGYGAGIGGGWDIACGNITIAGGTITATGGGRAAGIGGGSFGSCGTITITDGVTSVKATKGSQAPKSIGAGLDGSCGTVTIGGAVGAITTSPYTYYGTGSGSAFGNNIVNPVFTNVTISNTTANISTTYADFIGSYAPISTGLLDAHNPNGEAMHAALNIATPDKTGYTFGGWYTDASMTEPATTIPFAANGTVTLYAKWMAKQLELANNDDNGDALDLASGDGMYYDVTLADRTIYRDGDWNTLCLPFDVDNFSGTPLEGATVKTLESSEYNNGTLTMNFSNDLTSIDAGVPYIVKWDADLVIRSAADWNTFATNVNNGTESYQGKTVKLAADISVTTMVGTVSGSTPGRAFCGTFDGGGHTLNVSISDTDNRGTAPFRYISNATIKNLKTTGTVTGNRHCSGLVGFAASSTTNSIQNCEVAVSVVCNESYCGGILGHGLTSTTTIRDCLFSGSISDATTATGIIYGWGDGGTHTIVNCLANGTYTNCGGLDIIMKKGTYTVTNCYKTQNIGSLGTYTTATGETLRALLGDGWEVSNSNVVPKMVSDIVNPVFTNVTIENTTTNVSTTYADFIGSYAPISTGLLDAHNPNGEAMHAALNIATPDKTGYTFGGWYTDASMTEPATTIPFAANGTVTLYAKWMAKQLELANNDDNGDALDLASGDGMYYDVTLADRTIYRDGDWNTLCLPFDVDNFTGTPLEGATVKTLTSSDFNDGTLTMNFSDNLTSIDAGVPYIVKWDADLVIRSAADWNTFAANVTNGMESYEGKTVKLAADISVTTMVGTSSNPFKGTFDGFGHTLTFNYNATANDCAPFRYIDGATIRNLRVAGTITTSQKFAAGIAAYSYNNCVIESCQSSITITATIDGDGTHSGFIAYPQNGTVNFRNCLFDGKLLGSNTSHNGGFVGYRKNACSSIAYTNCLFAPTELTMSTSNSCTFNRNDGNTFTNTYYTKVFGTAQGTSTAATGEALRALLGDGWEVSGNNVVPKMNPDIVNPVFTGVNISDATANVSTTYVDFIGTYSPEVIYESGDEKHNLYLGSGNNLYYPTTTDFKVNACRGYFVLKNGLTCSEPSSPNAVRAFNLSFGDNTETQGIMTTDYTDSTDKAGAWFDLQGRRVSESGIRNSELRHGLYIHNGRKVVIK